MVRRKVKFKQAKAVEHICDKIFIDDVGNVIGITPFNNNNPMKSIYAFAIRKTLKGYAKDLIKWLLILAASVLLTAAAVNYDRLVLAFAFAGGAFIPFAVHCVCDVLSFKGKVLDNLPSDPNFPMYFANATVRYVEATEILAPPQRVAAEGKKANKQAKLDADYEKKLVKVSRENAESYNKLDRLSQVLDTDFIRIKKMRLLLSLDAKLSYGWEYESDSVLTKSADLNRNYINRIAKIDKNCLGPVSMEIYMNRGDR